MHANDGEYWNRKNMYNTLGYQDFFDGAYYNIPTDKKSEDFVGLGLSDRSFFEQIIPILKILMSHMISIWVKLLL